MPSEVLVHYVDTLVRWLDGSGGQIVVDVNQLYPKAKRLNRLESPSAPEECSSPNIRMTPHKVYFLKASPFPSIVTLQTNSLVRDILWHNPPNHSIRQGKDSLIKSMFSNWLLSSQNLWCHNFNSMGKAKVTLHRGTDHLVPSWNLKLFCIVTSENTGSRAEIRCHMPYQGMYICNHR